MVGKKQSIGQKGVERDKNRVAIAWGCLSFVLFLNNNDDGTICLLSSENACFYGAIAV